MKEGEGCELAVREERKLRREALLLPGQSWGLGSDRLVLTFRFLTLPQILLISGRAWESIYLASLLH